MASGMFEDVMQPPEPVLATAVGGSSSPTPRSSRSPLGGSTSKTIIPLTAPVMMPMFASGKDVHQLWICSEWGCCLKFLPP